MFILNEPGNKTKKNEGKKPDIRFLYDLKGVLYDREWLKTAPNFELYYMYRGVEWKDELRYDITVIPPRMLGQEFVKTKGHYHVGKKGELYIVLEGKGIFLLQKGNAEKGKIEDVYYVRAKKGESVLIPSFYGHITINPSFKRLKMANWISKECRSDYKGIEKRKGACYYYLKSGWIKNRNYKIIPKLHFKWPKKILPKDISFLYGQ